MKQFCATISAALAVLIGPTMTVHAGISTGAYILSVPGDLDLNGTVDGADLNILLSFYGDNSGSRADINFDGVVDTRDLNYILASWSDMPIVSLQHVSGDYERRLVLVEDVLDVDQSPFYIGWSRVWIRTPNAERVGIDIPLSRAGTRSVLFSRGWRQPA